MGDEYKVRFAHDGAASVVAEMEKLPMLVGGVDAENRFVLRSDRNTDTFPDASARVEHDGLYYCDHGGSGREFLGVVLTRLVSRFGPVTLENYE